MTNQCHPIVQQSPSSIPLFEMRSFYRGVKSTTSRQRFWKRLTTDGTTEVVWSAFMAHPDVGLGVDFYL